MNKKLKVYTASGWFSPNQEEVLNTLEGILKNSPLIEPYFPRHDGVKLNPGELHDSGLRKKVFEDNVEHIIGADLVVAACDGRDGYYDTGTQWEIGYAMANHIPVIAYDTTEHVYDNLRSLVKGFIRICHTPEELLGALSDFYRGESMTEVSPSKVLFIGPDTTEDQQETNKDIVSSVILECHGSDFRWVDDLTTVNLYNSIDDIFDGIKYVVSVIDDRHPVVSWLMGQAYSRGIPVVTYTNFDYGVNIMLLCSLLYHCKGKDELKRLMQKIKRDGIASVPKFDDSATRAM